MGLKVFHVVFMVVSALMFLWVGFWCLGEYDVTGNQMFLVSAVLTMMASVGLGGYIFWFFKKSPKLTLAAVGLFFSQSVYPCSVCFADPDSVMAKSTNAGITFLLVVIVVLLVAFAALFLYWGRRMKRLRSINGERQLSKDRMAS